MSDIASFQNREAELVLSLLKRASAGYVVEISFIPAGSDADAQLLRDSSTAISIDHQELLSLSLDDRSYGLALARSLFGNGDSALYRAFERARDNATQAETALRLRLWVNSSASELHGLRWETLRDPLDETPLFTGGRLFLSRYLSSPDMRVVRPRSRGELRAIAAIANPTGLNLAPINVAEQQWLVEQGLAIARPTILASGGSATLNNVVRHLRDGANILYLAAHGRFDQNGEPVVWLEQEDGTGKPVPGKEIVTRIRELSELPRLIVLISCQSAGTGGGSEDEGRAVLAALGPQLATAGVPAVLAMQGNLSMTTASRFLPTFFTELQRSGQIDQALAVARGDVRDQLDWWMPALFTRLRNGRLWVEGAPTAHDPRPSDMELHLGLARLERIVPSHGPGLERDVNQYGHALRVWLAAPAGERESLTFIMVELDKISDALFGITFDRLARGPEPQLPEAVCPFRGLYAFRPEDQPFFFGREELVAELLERLQQPGLLAILGESGCGKSSLVFAGLVPALREQLPDLAVVTLRPSYDPLAQWDATVGTATAPQLLVVIDQFEEIFTLCADEAERIAFIDRALALSAIQRLVITMRADFILESTRYRSLSQAFERCQKLIGPMTASEIQRAMELQARAGGLVFEPGLSQVILDDVFGEPGAMPLLQHALQELWKRRQGRWLRTATYQAVGGVQQAIAQTASSLYQQLNDDDRALMRHICVRLTRLDTGLNADTRRDTRQRVPLQELIPNEGATDAIRRLLERLANERLIVKRVNEAQGPEAIEVEVAHEALIRYWPQLREWLNADRTSLVFQDTLRDAAREWQLAGHDSALLIHRDSRLRKALALAADIRSGISAFERSYIEACQEAEKDEQPLKYIDRMRWAVVVPDLEDTTVLQALWPLIQHSMRQMGYTKLDYDFQDSDINCGVWVKRHTDGYKKSLANAWGEIPPVLIVRPDEQVYAWLARYSVAPGPVNPKLGVPFYLMIVGRPGPLVTEDKAYISFNFQYQLDIQFGVGRVQFDQLSQYRCYAESVVAAESGILQISRQAAFFATKHEDDTSTIRSHDELVVPLLSHMRASHPRWVIQAALEKDALRTRLENLLGGPDTPAIFFSASHGIGLNVTDERLINHQGALVTQDFPGFGRIKREHWFAGEDLPADARLLGSMAFLFAPYSAGTPQQDEFIFDPDKQRPIIAPRALIAKLPQALLSHPNGGMLAVVGHVERAWTYSFSGTEAGTTRQITLFAQFLDRLIGGYPVGAAMEAFHARYAEISAQLTAELEAIMYGATPDPTLLSRRWMARTDARNYLVVGDPAVRLPLADTIEGQAIRPTLAELEAMRADKDGQASTL